MKGAEALQWVKCCLISCESSFLDIFFSKWSSEILNMAYLYSQLGF